MIAVRLGRGYLAFVLVPSVVAGLAMAAFMAWLGAHPATWVAEALAVASNAILFGLLVTWPVSSWARRGGRRIGLGAVTTSGAVLGAVFAVLVADLWLFRAGAPFLSSPSIGTVGFAVMAFGVPVGIFSAVAAWNAELRE